VIALFSLVFLSTAHAKSVETTVSFDWENIEADSGWTATISLNTRLKMSTIAGEPKVNCTGLWELISVSNSEGISIDIKQLPRKIIDDVTLHSVTVLFSTGHPASLYDSAVACDLGVMSRSGSSKSSKNFPGSPDWSKLFVKNAIYETGKTLSGSFHTKRKAKKHLEFLLDKGQIDKSVSTRILKASININAIRRHIEKENKKKNAQKKELDDFEKLLEEAETGNNGQLDEFDNSLASIDGEASGKENISSLESMLDEASDFIEQKQRRIIEKERQQLAEAKQRAVRVCDDGLCGYKDEQTDTMILDYQYDIADYEFVDGMSLVAKDGYAYLIDPDGNPVSSKINFYKHTTYSREGSGNNTIIIMKKFISGRDGKSCGVRHLKYRVVKYNMNGNILSDDNENKTRRSICLTRKRR